MSSSLVGTLLDDPVFFAPIAAYFDARDRSPAHPDGDLSTVDVHEQTLHGKAPVDVAATARRQGVPVFALTGRNLLFVNSLRGAGIEAIYALTNIEAHPAVHLANAAEFLHQLGRRISNDVPDRIPATI